MPSKVVFTLDADIKNGRRVNTMDCVYPDDVTEQQLILVAAAIIHRIGKKHGLERASDLVNASLVRFKPS